MKVCYWEAVILIHIPYIHLSGNTQSRTERRHAPSKNSWCERLIMQTIIPTPGPISWGRRLLPATIALGLVLAFGFARTAAAQSASAQSNGPLSFGNNFFVTGDYVVAGAQGLNTNFASDGMTRGTITIPDANRGIQPGPTANCIINGKPATNCVPAGAQIVAAILYWQTVEKVGQTGSGQNGTFRPLFTPLGQQQPRYPLSGVSISSQSTVSFSSGGCTGSSTGKLVRTYRADVRGYLPLDASGNVLANGTYEIRLPSVGPSTPLTLGATLVLIYRVLSPNVPLNSIVIYDGDFAPGGSLLTMTQTVQGFYDAAESPVSRLTHVVGQGKSNKFENVYLNNMPLPSLYGNGLPPFPGFYGGSTGYGWDNTTWTFGANSNPVHDDDASATTMVAPTTSNMGCVSWGAVIFSTTVQNSDNDGLLDVWKANQGYTDVGTGQFVSLADSNDPINTGHPRQDVFIQLDHVVDPKGDFTPDPLVLPELKNAFLAHNIHLHITDASKTTGIPGANAIPEPACTDASLPPPQLCAYPNQPGITTWREGFEFIENQPLNGMTEAQCEASPSTCVRRFPPAQRNSHHYVVFGDTLGAANWGFVGGGLTDPAGKVPGVVVQFNNMVTFYTSRGHGLVANDPVDGNGRVTITGAITNPNLNGTHFVKVVNCPVNPDTNAVNDCSVSNRALGPYTFTIQIGTSAITQTTVCPAGTVAGASCYTLNTDPNLSVASGQATTGSGFSDLGGKGTLVTLGSWPLAYQTASAKAGTLMHELGHTLGLLHGGGDNTNCKSNYQSVMNYMFQTKLLGPSGALDFSSQQLSTLDETSLLGTPITTMGIPLPNIAFTTTRWYDTKPTFAIVNGKLVAVGATATKHCDGTPLSITDPTTYGFKGGTNPLLSEIAIPWSSNSLDINFEGGKPGSESKFLGYNDWAKTDLRQVGAAANEFFGVPGGGFIPGGPGGGFVPGGPGGGFIPGGPGGGFVPGGPGGGFIPGGPGGGFVPGGPGASAELDVATAVSVTDPPSNLMASEDASPRNIHLSWIPATFPQMEKFNIYRSSDNGATFSFLSSVPAPPLPASGTPPPVMYTDTVTCNPTGYAYFVTSILLNTTVTPSQEQESTPSNTVSTGQNGQPLTSCYAPTGFNLSASANAVHGSIVSVTFTVLDASNAMNAPVNTTDNPALVTLVTNGPLPNNCAMVGDTTILANGTLTPQSGASTFPASIGGHYTLNLDTDVLCAGQYTLKLILDNQVALTSHQMATAPLQLSIDVNDTDTTPHVTTLALTAGTVGLAYNNTLTQHGGTAPFTWTFSGSLPAGISQLPLNSPTLTGTTCAAGAYNFTAMVTDAKSNSGTQPLTLQINKANTTTGVISNANPSVFQQMVTFTVTVVPQYSCTPTGTVTLFDGVTPIASNLALSGGMATFTTSALSVGMHNITASYGGDSNFNGSNSNSAPLSQTVNKANTATTITSVSPSPAVVGQAITVAYTLAVVPLGAGTPIVPTGTVTVAASDNSGCVVPAALGAGACVLSPAPTIAGTMMFTVTYTGDSNFIGSIANSQYTVLIFVSDSQPTPPPPFTPTKTLPNGVVGSPYTNTIYESGGVTTGPNNFSWSLAQGSNPLPPGLSFQPNTAGVTNGTLSGTPTSAGTFTFTAMVTDSASNTGTQNLTVTVLAPAPAPYGLVSWYPFEGNANDLEKINNGNVVGTPQFVPAEVDNGLKPGPQLSGSLITVPDSPTLALTQFTIGAWVRVDNLDNVETMQIVWKGDASAGDLTTPYSLSVLGSANSSFSNTAVVVGTAGPGKVLVILTDGTHELDLVSTNALPLDGKFHYVAVTADGQKVNLYIDGVLDGNSPASETSLTGLPFTSTNLLQIGGVQGGPAPGNNFDGVIDELQIWNRVLTPSEISGIFNTVGEYQPAARPAGLVSWWPAEGSLTDIISGNNGMPSGVVGFAPGEVGQAFSFSGGSAEITVADNPNLDVGQITIEAWVKPTTSGHGRPIVQKRSSLNVGGYTFETTDTSDGPGPANGLQFAIWISGTQYLLQTPTNVLTIGAWQHVAATFDGSAMSIYVNGVLQATQAASGAIDTDAADPLVMGLNVVNNSYDWNGFTDEVSLYNRALTFTEIQGIVNAGGAGKVKP
jgi:hypothetical protein